MSYRQERLDEAPRACAARSHVAAKGALVMDLIRGQKAQASAATAALHAEACGQAH